jgi:hypothetical protein
VRHDGGLGQAQRKGGVVESLIGSRRLPVGLPDQLNVEGEKKEGIKVTPRFLA